MRFANEEAIERFALDTLHALLKSEEVMPGAVVLIDARHTVRGVPVGIVSTFATFAEFEEAATAKNDDVALRRAHLERDQHPEGPWLLLLHDDGAFGLGESRGKRMR
jgi:hypothetical protein